MEAAYWQKKWAEEKIGFHQKHVNKRLEERWAALDAPAGCPVFVPLCGKSLDMLWLHRQGHPVLGVEISEKAVGDFFAENALPVERETHGAFVLWRGTGEAEGIRLLVGDFFALEPADLAEVGAFYDRASLIAMGEGFRVRYARHLAAIVPGGVPGLLLTIDYDPARMQGPPFPVPDALTRELLGSAFHIDELARYGGPERLGNLAGRGLETLDEHVYRLRRH